MTWQLQDAKQRFSQLVDDARDQGPQIVTRNGREVVAVIAIEDFRRLSAPTPAEVLLGGPTGDALADLLDAVIAERHSPDNMPRDVAL